MYDDPLVAYPDDPTTDVVHQPYTAFNQGYEARNQDIPQSLNPYQEGSREYDWWDEGWETADRHAAIDWDWRTWADE